MLMFHLKKPYLELGKQEIIELHKPKKSFVYDDLFFCDFNESNLKFSLKIADFFSKRLGFCHSIYGFIFKSTKKKFLKNVENYDWAKIYKGNFCVRYHGNFFQEKKIADLIYNKIKEKIKKPIVNLKNPKTKIEFFELKDNIFAGLFLKEVDKSYHKRKAHFRPGFYPTSLSPDLARACINLTGLKKGIIFDPFCGVGGILIEAGLMGFKVIGNDIVEKQLQYAKKNFEFYKIINFKLLNKDARKIKLNDFLDNLNLKENNFSIVSDLPYGKNSFGKNLDNLYYDFLLNAKYLIKNSKKKNPKNNMVLIFPHFINYKKIIKKAKWKIKKTFFYYVHKSLTRIILVLALY